MFPGWKATGKKHPDPSSRTVEQIQLQHVGLGHGDFHAHVVTMTGKDPDPGNTSIRLLDGVASIGDQQDLEDPPGGVTLRPIVREEDVRSGALNATNDVTGKDCITGKCVLAQNTHGVHWYTGRWYELCTGSQQCGHLVQGDLL